MNATKIQPLTADRPATPNVYVGAAILSVHRDNPTSYRVQVCDVDTRAQVDELTHSFPTEAEARQIARNLFRGFWRGRSVAQVIAELANVVDAALDRAEQGGDGTGRHTRHLGTLNAFREQLRPAAERAQRRQRLDGMAAYLAGQVDTMPAAEATPPEESRPLTLAGMRTSNLTHLGQPTRRGRKPAAR